MTSGIKQRAWVGLLLLAILFIVLPFALYFYVYVGGRTQYRETRSFRALGEVVDEVSNQVLHLKNLFKYSEFCGKRVGAPKDYCKIRPSSPPDNYLAGLRRSPAFRNLRFQMVEREIGGAASVGGISLAVEKRSDGFALRATERWGSKEPCRKWQRRVSRPCRTELGEEEFAEWHDEWSGYSTSGDGGTTRSVQIPLVDLIPHVPEDFDQILLANGSGSVLASRQAVGGDHVIRVEGIGHLIKGLHSPRSEEASEKLEERRDQWIPHLTMRREIVPMGDVNALFFIQPFRLPFVLEPSFGHERGDSVTGAYKLDRFDSVFYAVGVISEPRFRAEVTRAPRTVVGLFCALLILGALAWPYAKVRYRGEHERLRPFDAYCLLGTAVLGGSTLVILLLSSLAYDGMISYLDERATAIADSLVENALGEMAAAARKLGDFDPDDVDGETVENEYPGFELAFEVDASGNQVGEQERYRRAPTRKVSVPSRQYFLRAKAGEGFNPSPNWELKVYPQRIQTYGQALKMTALAMKEGDGVKVAVRRIHSLWKPVLPFGFHFAVIDSQEGKVLYHSTDAKSLATNFYLETENSDRLHGAAVLRQADHFDRSYHGREHRLYVRPFDGLPWTVVVMYDLEVVQSTIFEIAFVAIMCAVLYALAFAALVAGLSIVARPTRWSWVWPDPTKSFQYIDASWLLFILLVVAVVAMAVPLQHWWPVVVLATMPVAVFSICYPLLRRDEPSRRYLRLGSYVGILMSLTLLAFACFGFRETPREFVQIMLVIFFVSLAVIFGCPVDRHVKHGDRVLSRRYQVFFCLLLLLISAVPGGIVYRAAFTLYSETLTRLGHHHVHAQIAERASAFRSDCERLDVSGDHFYGCYSDKQFLRGIYARSGEGQRAGFGDERVSAQPSGDLRDNEGPVEAASREIAKLGLPCFSGPRLAEGAGSIPGDGRSGLSSGGLGRWIAVLLPSWAGAFPVGGQAVAAGDISLRTFALPLSQLLPSYGRLSGLMRYAAFDRPSDDRWYSVVESSGMGDENVHMCFTDASGEATRRLSAPIVGLGTSATMSGRIRFGVGVLALLGGMIAFVASISKRVFGLVIVTPGRVSLAQLKAKWSVCPPQPLTPVPISSEAGREIIVGLPKAEANCIAKGILSSSSVESVHIFECGPDPVQEIPPRQTVVVVGFEALDDAAINRRVLLRYLETHLQSEENDLVILSRIPPDRVVMRVTGGCTRDDAATRGSFEQRRWLAVLASCTVTFVDCSEKLSTEGRGATEREDAEPLSTDPTENGTRSVLRRECSWHPQLKPIWEELRSSRLPASTDTLIEKIGSRAESTYQSIWLDCSREERLILRGLASGELVNPASTDLRTLMRRGLVIRSPDFRPVCESFSRFVLTAERPQVWAEWESESEASTWMILKWPLALSLVVIAAFIGHSGGPLRETSAAIIPAGFAALPVILQLVRTLRVARGEPGSNSEIV